VHTTKSPAASVASNECIALGQNGRNVRGPRWVFTAAIAGKRVGFSDVWIFFLHHRQMDTGPTPDRYFILPAVDAACLHDNKYIRMIVFTARRYATSYGSVSVSVTTWTVGVLAKRMDGSSYFWHEGFLTSIVHSVLRKFGYL